MSSFGWFPSQRYGNDTTLMGLSKLLSSKSEILQWGFHWSDVLVAGDAMVARHLISSCAGKDVID